MCDETLNAITSAVSDTAGAVGSAAADVGSAIGTGVEAAGTAIGDLFSPSAATGGGIVGADAAAGAGAAADAGSAAPLAAVTSGALPALSTPPVGAAVAPGAVGDVAANAIGAQSGSAVGTALDASSSDAARGLNVGSLLNNAPSASTVQAPVLDSAMTGNIPSQALDGKPTPPASDPGFFSSKGQLNDILNSPVTRLAAGIAPAAATLAKGQPSVPASTAPLQPGGAVTGPLIATETGQLNAANAGTITPPQQAQIATFVQNAQNQLFQQLANAGVTDPTKDSRYVQGLQDIERQKQGMIQSFIQQAFTTGFTAAGQAAGALNSAATHEVATDTSFQDALSKAIESFGLIEGISQPKAA